MSGSFSFFENQSVDGTSNEYVVTKGGQIHIRAFGNFGGGTVNIEMSFNDSDFVTLENGTLTEGGGKRIFVKVGETIRLDLAGSTGADLSADAVGT